MTQIPLTPALLDALVTRVEEGEPLTQEELDLIGHQVIQRPDSLDWRLCFAHALINSDQPHKALEVLKFEGADSLHEILLHLVKARALGALERYAEAEVELKKILRIYPGHADALRALAILRLKAGSPADAVALCESVLLADPLDLPTKTILAEAKAAMDEVSCGLVLPDGSPVRSLNPEPPQTQRDVPEAHPHQSKRVEAMSKAAFFKKLDEGLRQLGWKHRIECPKDELIVELPHRGPVRLTVTDFWEAGRGTTERRAQAVADLLAELKRIDEQTPQA